MTDYQRFIPVRKAEFLRRLKEDFGFTGARGGRFDMFCELLYHLYRHTYEALFNELIECYDPFDPDRETVTLDTCDDAERERRKTRFCERFAELMDVANYERMTREEFEKAFRERPAFGIQVYVDTGDYEILEIFYRGHGDKKFQKRSVRSLMRKVDVSVDCYRRLVAVVKRRDQPFIHIKVFKDIPKNALETLLPHVQVRMKLLDKLKLGGSGLAGVVFASLRIASKAFQFVGSVAFATLIAICAACGYALKTFLGFKSTQQRYFSDLARTLYANSLVSNLSVIQAGIDMAVEEELQEAALAWCVLNGEKELIPKQEVKRRAEAYLEERYGVSVDYEIGDALAKLVGRGLLIDREGGLSVFGLDESLRKLDAIWDGLYVTQEAE